jgi:hypothetical protein
VALSLQTILIENEDNVKAARDPYTQPVQLDWLKKWTAQLEFLLTVVDKSDVKGSVGDDKTPLSLAGTYSREATRKETISFSYNIQDFSDPKTLSKARERLERGPGQCDPSGAHSDQLKFIDWLRDVTLGAYIGTGKLFLTRITAIKHQISFVVIYEGKAAPVWKVVNLDIEGQRANTQDIVITLSPPESTAQKPNL